MLIATRPVVRASAPYTVALACGATHDLSVLTPSERREHDRLPHDARRRDWLAGRCAAKRAVAARCGEALDRIQLEPRVGAAPVCMVRGEGDCWAPLALSLTIAHRDGVAIAAAAEPSTLIGVDIERIGEIAREQRRYFIVAGEATDDIDATLAWVLKEAAWKALALGPGIPFTAVQLAFAHGSRRLHGIVVEGSWIPARARVVRVSSLRPLLAAVLEIRRDDAGAVQ